MIERRLSDEEVLEIFKESGALLSGHFQLTSGLHSDAYFEKFKVLQHPKYAQRLCQELASRFQGDGIDVVVGPATGGIIIAYEVGRQLGVRAIFTEREDGAMKLRRGFAVAPEEKVLVVEDIVTTGGSVREVLRTVAETGADLVGVGFLCDRTGGAIDFGVRKEALLTVDVKAWEPDACPLCAAEVPFTERGSKHL